MLVGVFVSVAVAVLVGVLVAVFVAVGVEVGNSPVIVTDIPYSVVQPNAHGSQ